MSLRPCITCGILSPFARCPAHRSRHRNSTRDGYGSEWRRQVARAIEAEPWCHTPECRYADAGTPTNTLTGDHPLPRRAFATQAEWSAQEITVLCQRCNSSKRDRIN